ncbi:FYVE-type domain-containing protein [Balamuthia mandrillaris]
MSFCQACNSRCELCEGFEANPWWHNKCKHCGHGSEQHGSSPPSSSPSSPTSSPSSSATAVTAMPLTSFSSPSFRLAPPSRPPRPDNSSKPPLSYRSSRASTAPAASIRDHAAAAKQLYQQQQQQLNGGRMGISPPVRPRVPPPQPQQQQQQQASLSLSQTYAVTASQRHVDRVTSSGRELSATLTMNEEGNSSNNNNGLLQYSGTEDVPVKEEQQQKGEESADEDSHQQQGKLEKIASRLKRRTIKRHHATLTKLDLMQPNTKKEKEGKEKKEKKEREKLVSSLESSTEDLLGPSAIKALQTENARLKDEVERLEALSESLRNSLDYVSARLQQYKAHFGDIPAEELNQATASSSQQFSSTNKDYPSSASSSQSITTSSIEPLNHLSPDTNASSSSSAEETSQELSSFTNNTSSLSNNPPPPPMPPAPLSEQSPTNVSPEAEKGNDLGRMIRRGHKHMSSYHFRSALNESGNPLRKLQEQEKRHCVAKEILTTERSYLLCLTILIEEFLQPLEQKAKALVEQKKTNPWITQENIRSMFYQITVIRGYSSLLLSQLEDRIGQHWSVDSCLGDIFVEMGDFFKVYGSYINNYNKALETFKQCKQNKKFNDCMEELRANGVRNQQFKGYTLETFLITPVQRIPRYINLLKELLKYTPANHADHEKIKQALRKVEEVADANEKGQETNDKMKGLFYLQKRFSLESQAQVQQLVEPHRRLLHADQLRVHRYQPGSSSSLRNPHKEKRRELFLFNDFLLFARLSSSNAEEEKTTLGTTTAKDKEKDKETKKEKDKPDTQPQMLHYKFELELENCRVKDIPSYRYSLSSSTEQQQLQEEDIEHQLFSFQLLHTEVAVRVTAASMEQKQRWMRLLEDAIQQRQRTNWRWPASPSSSACIPAASASSS